MRSFIIALFALCLCAPAWAAPAQKAAASPAASSTANTAPNQNACGGIPAPAAAMGYTTNTLCLQRFDPKDVDYELTYKSGKKIGCFNFFGLNCTGKASSFTGSVTASTSLVVTAATAGTGVLFPFAGTSCQPLTGAGVTPGTCITAQSPTTGGVSVLATASWTAVAGQTIAVASCTNIHAYMAVYDVTASALVGYVAGCTGTTLTLPSNQIGSTVAPAIASTGAADALEILGGVGTYTINTSQTVVSEAMSTPSFWENSDGTMTLLQDADTFTAELSTATKVGSGFVGTVYGGPAYFEVQVKMTATCPFAGGSWPGGQYVTPVYADLQNGVPLHWLGQATGYGQYVELDDPEFFQCLFGWANNQIVFTPHHFYNYPNATATQFQGTQLNTTSSTLSSAFHYYGMSINPGSFCFYFDRTQVGCQTFAPFVIQHEPAGGSFTTSSTSIPMANNNPGNVIAGMTVFDNSLATPATIGTVASYGISNGLLTDAGSNSDWGSTTTTVVNVNHAIAAGHLLTVSVYDGLASHANGAGTLADAALDTFTKDASCEMGASSGNGWLSIYHTYTAGLSNAGAVTYTTAGASVNFVSVNVSEAGGMVAAGFDGATCTSYSSGSTTTSGNVTPTTGGDLAVGIVGQNATGAITQATGFQAPPPAGWPHDANRALGGNEIVSGTTPTAYAPTVAGGITGGWASASALFKVTAGGTPTLTLASASTSASAGSADDLIFTEAPPPLFTTPWTFSPLMLAGQSMMNPKYGGGPQNPNTYQSITIWQPNALNNITH